jgi:DTW domain-containing protein YfiP
VMPPSEARSASNTARLLALWLPTTQLYIRGGADGLPGPEALIHRPHSAVLFPGSGQSRPLDRVDHLIVPDGTWSQARRIHRRWFETSALPSVELTGPWPSLYGLRRHALGVCTFEAAAIALGQLSQAAVGAELLNRFAVWAERAQWLKSGDCRVSPQAPYGRHPAVPRLLGDTRPSCL